MLNLRRYKIAAALLPAYLLAALTAMLLSGCSFPITMKDPRTGQVAQCGPYFHAGVFAIANTEREAQCVADFRMQGYQRQP